MPPHHPERKLAASTAGGHPVLQLHLHVMGKSQDSDSLVSVSSHTVSSKEPPTGDQGPLWTHTVT